MGLENTGNPESPENCIFSENQVCYCTYTQDGSVVVIGSDPVNCNKPILSGEPVVYTVQPDNTQDREFGNPMCAPLVFIVVVAALSYTLFSKRMQHKMEF